MSQATHWKTRDEVRSVKQRQNFKSIKCKVHENQQGVPRHLSEVQQEVHQVASREKVDIFRHELRLLKDHVIRIRLRQANLVRPKVHQKFSSCDMTLNMRLYTVVTWKPDR